MRPGGLLFLILLVCAVSAHCQDAALSPRVETGSVLRVIAQGGFSNQPLTDPGPTLPGSIPDPGSPRLGLVLTGGGGRGFAQIGALRALEDAGIPLYCVVGTSMGALVGGLYCSGYSPEQIRDELSPLTWDELFNDSPNRLDMYTGAKEIADRHLLQVRFDGFRPQWIRSFSTGQKVREILGRLFYRAPMQCFGDFDRLELPYRAIATDLITGKMVSFAEGDLAEAIRASMSVPLLFSPVVLDTLLLVDGGISNNVPVNVAREMGADRVLVVDSTSPLRLRSEINEAWEVADQVVSIMQADPNRRAFEMADLVVRPRIGHSTLESIEGIDSLVEAGYRAMAEHLDELRASLEGVTRPRSRIPGWRGLILEGDARELSGVLPESSDSLERSALDSLLRAACSEERFRWSHWKLEELQGEDRESGWVLRVDAELWPRVESVHLQVHRGLVGLTLPDLGPVNGPLGRKTLDARLDSLLEDLRYAGYTLARVDSLRLDGTRLDIFIDPGHVETVRVEGLSRVSKRRVLAEFSPRAGEVFRLDVAESRIRRLHASGLFEQVQMGLEREEDRNVVEIRVVERVWPVLRAGLHYSSAREGRAFLELDNERLLGGFLRGTLYYSYGAVGETSRVTFESDRLFSSLWTARLELRSVQELYHWRDSSLADGLARVEQETHGGALSLGRQWPGLGTVYVGLSARDLSEEGERGSSDLRAFGLELQSVVDSRDQLGLPRRGEYHVVSLTNTLKSLGADASWLQFRSRFDSWRSLGRTTGHATLIYEFADSPPALDRSRIGGGDMLATLRPGEWQGAQLLGTGLELRRLISENRLGAWQLGSSWHLVMVNDRAQFQLKREDLRQEAAMYLALNSVAGPLLAGVSLALDRQPGDSRWVLWTELGFTFD
ncbi:MAG: patatin-like phospholipase family protein [Candidatus Cloacimonetes bacterium]|nr:patatin-like phospholipase family protein [Candidatus Cloacimonadota bacterium]